MVRGLATFGLGHCQVESGRPLPDDPTPLAYLKSNSEGRE